MLKKIGGFFQKNWYKIIFGLVFVFVFSALYLYKLGSFVRGDSIYETTTYLEINGIEPILQNISLAPIKTLELIMVKIDEPNSTLTRLVSVFFVGVSLIVFYRLILKWQTHRTAMLSTLMFASSALVLSIGRFTSQEAMYFLVIPALLLMGTWLKSKKYVKRVIYIFPTWALLMYLPGFLLISLIILIIFKKRLLLAWKFSDIRLRFIGLLMSIMLITPLIYSVVVNPSQIFTLLGIDRLMDYGIQNVINRLIDIPVELFWSGIDQPHLWLYGTPILDIITVVFFALGIYAYTKSDHTLRARLLLILTITCVVIISFSTVATLALLIPIVYIYVAKGLSFMLQNWFTVFPRNPAARNVGAILLFIPVFLSVGYNVQKYFVVWHSAPETAQALSIKE